LHKFDGTVREIPYPQRIQHPGTRRHQVALFTTLTVNASTDAEAPERFLLEE
jgi:hypothetical protein